VQEYLIEKVCVISNKIFGMGFIEITNIENMTGSADTWAAWFKAISGAVVGFLLGLIPGWWARRSNVTTAGELANTDINNMKLAIETQLLSTRMFTSELQSTDEATKLLSYTNWLKHRFEFIKTVDKVDLVKFHKREVPSEAVEYVQGIFQALGVLDLQMKKMDEQYLEYVAFSDGKVREYAELLNTFNRLAIIEREKLGVVNYKKDKILVALFENIFDKKKALNGTVVINYLTNLHPNLKDNLFTDYTHPLYIQIKEFDVKGTMIINDLTNKKLLFVNHIKRTEEGLQEAYLQLYGHAFVIPGA